MLRKFPTGRILAVTSECCPSILQQVRWARKPIALGTAKSKIFRIPVKPKIPLIESEELKRLFNKYRTEVKSVRKFLYNKYNVKLMAKADTEEINRAFEEDFARCNEINNQWNAEIAQAREVRVQAELDEDINFAQNRIQSIKLKEEENRRKADEDISQAKQLNLITSDNIDEAIEYALNNPVDYNFAIDLEGNRIVGSEPFKKEAVKN